MIFRPGQGLLYGTSTGKLCLVVPDLAKENSAETEDSLTDRERLEQNSRNRDNLRARLRSAQRQDSVSSYTEFLATLRQIKTYSDYFYTI